jgi:recombination protein RecA
MARKATAKTAAASGPPVIVDPNDLNVRLDAALAKYKLLNVCKLAEENPLNITTFPTGFPQLDQLLDPNGLGFPRGVDIEVFSPYGQAGKTSLCLQILAAAQRNQMSCALVEVERTTTDKYMNTLGLVLDNSNPTVPALRILRAETGSQPLTVEQVMDALISMSQVFDIIVVDSIAALDKKANLEKDATENTQMGGIAKNISEFCRRNLVRKSTIFWINQMREDSKAYSPSGATVLKPTGGRAMGFFSFVRLELRVLGKVKEGDNNVGMEIEIKALKNKMGYPDRKTKLVYLFGMGYSAEWDYAQLAMKLSIVEKSGSWYQFTVPIIPTEDGGKPERGFRVQGFLPFVRALRADNEAFDAMKRLVDGEDLGLVEDIPDNEIEAA